MMTPAEASRLLVNTIGRRAAVLLLLGVLSIWWGWGLTTGVYPDPPGEWGVLYTLIPLPARVAGWVVAGVIGITAALVHRPKYLRAGYAALIVMPCERAVSWIIVTGLNVIDVIIDAAAALATRAGHPVASPQLWSQGSAIGLGEAIGWTALSLIVFTLAGWRESPGHEIAKVLEDADADHRL